MQLNYSAYPGFCFKFGLANNSSGAIGNNKFLTGSGSAAFKAHCFRNTPNRIRSCRRQLSQYNSLPLSASKVVGSYTLAGLTNVMDVTAEAPRAARSWFNNT